MRFQLIMLPVAVVAASSAEADTYMTVVEAQALIFPGAKFSPADITLNETQLEQLIAETRAVVYHSRVKAWKVSTGGWFLLDQVPGRDDVVTYAIGLDKKGAIVGMEVLVCTSGYDSVRDQKWLGHFTGNSRETEAALTNEIPIITGTTLSSEHIIEGVRRVLSTYALFIAPKAG